MGMVVLQVYMLFVHRPAAHHVIHSFLGGYAGYQGGGYGSYGGTGGGYRMFNPPSHSPSHYLISIFTYFLPSRLPTSRLWRPRRLRGPGPGLLTNLPDVNPHASLLGHLVSSRTCIFSTSAHCSWPFSPYFPRSALHSSKFLSVTSWYTSLTLAFPLASVLFTYTYGSWCSVP